MRSRAHPPFPNRERDGGGARDGPPVAMIPHRVTLGEEGAEDMCAELEMSSLSGEGVMEGEGGKRGGSSCRTNPPAPAGGMRRRSRLDPSSFVRLVLVVHFATRTAAQIELNIGNFSTPDHATERGPGPYPPTHLRFAMLDEDINASLK